MKKIRYELIELRRKELRLSQTDVAEKVAKLTGEKFSQQAYRKVEKGISKNSKYLAYVCQVLGISLSKINPALNEDLESGKDALIEKLNELPQSDRLEIIQEVLRGLESK